MARNLSAPAQVVRHPAGSPGVSVERLKKRGDFVAARRGQRVHKPGFTLQLRKRDDADEGVRIGFTVTKKIGNAVERNRIKRRLREAVRHASIPVDAVGRDAVLLARRRALDIPFSQLVGDLEQALALQ